MVVNRTKYCRRCDHYLTFVMCLRSSLASSKKSLPHGILLTIVLHMENYTTSLDQAFHALSDPTRRSVIQRLISGPATVKELSEPFSMGLPSFMKHIKVLEKSGLIRSQKTGRTRTCQIEPIQLTAAEKWLSEQRAIWEGRTDRLADYAESLASKERINAKRKL
jgi:DNA-binding transcriptional ArsR family regulator